MPINRTASIAGVVMHIPPQPQVFVGTDGLMIREMDGLLHRSCILLAFVSAGSPLPAAVGGCMLLQERDGVYSPARTAAADAVRRVRRNGPCVHCRAGRSDADPVDAPLPVGARAGVEKAPAMANEAIKRRRAAKDDVLDPEAVEELQVRASRSLSTYRSTPLA